MHRTDAHALEAILLQINDPSAANSLNARWKTALGVSPESHEFAKSHAEVVKLHDGVARYVDGLPPASKERYAASLHQC